MPVVGSLFSGVGGFDLGFERAGFSVAFQAEQDPWRRKVLAHRFPEARLYADVHDVRGEGAGRDGASSLDVDGAAPVVDVLVGGFPCQDLSVAGKRAGLAGARSGLFFEFARIADELVRPGGWVLIENVPGLLSSASGRDFAVLVRTLGDIGFHDLAWRVLDSRHFGVAQRRRRVYILGRRAGGRLSSEVLLESAGVRRDLETSWEARARAADTSRGGPESDRVATTLTRGSSGAGVSAPGRRQEDDFNIVAPSVTRKWSKGSGGPAGDECQNLVSDPRGVGERIRAGDLTQSLTTRFGNTGADLPDAEGNWLVPSVAPPVMSSQCGARTTDVDTGVYPIRADGAVRDGRAGSGAGVDDEPAGPDSAAGAAGPVREAQRGEVQRGRGDVGAGRHVEDAELDGAGGHERGAGGAGGRGTEAHPDRVRASTKFPRRLDGDSVDAHAASEGAAEALRGLREDDGAQGLGERPAGSDDPLQAPEVLRPALHGDVVRRAPGEDGAVVVHSSSSCAEGVPSGAVRDLRGNEGGGSSPRRGLAEQRSGEPAATLPQVPSEGAWGAPGNERPVREGTANPVDPQPDGRRYAAMGDAVTVNVIEWIAVRLLDCMENDESRPEAALGTA